MSEFDRKAAIEEAERNHVAARTRAQWSMKARLTRLRIAFEASRVQEPYFPLARFGRYYVAVRDVDGSIMSFSKRERAADPTRGVTLSNELKKRHQWVMNPMGAKWSQAINSTAFIYYLAATPAAAIVNTLQTPMMGIPILGARFGGTAKAAAALAKASADSVAGKGSVTNANLTDDEKRALAAFYESGLIDRTQSHDLAGVGETGVQYSPVRARVMAVISWLYHRAEVWNREVTALAAYRMARSAGQNVTQAIDTAHDLTWKTHFD